MGNCAAPSRPAASWTDEYDDGEPGSPEREEMAGVEVRIRISKRQLQELLENAAVAGCGGDEKVLACIIDAGEVVGHHHHHRHWQPTLQSIPEAVEP
uniref:Uncharacterized protein n=1 Tax=Oryza brachyantha TaxID=4533 RepID=J3M8J8_ORYBR